MKGRNSTLKSSIKKNIKELLIYRLSDDGTIELLEDLRNRDNESKISIKLKSQSKLQANYPSNTSISPNTENSHNSDTTDFPSFDESNNINIASEVNNGNNDPLTFLNYESNEYLDFLFSESDCFEGAIPFDNLFPFNF